MNSRERVLTTLAHREPDRVPLFFNSIEAKFLKTIAQGDLIRAWEVLGIDVLVTSRRSWCQGTPSGLGFSPDPPPPEESLGGSIYAGWNGTDEFGRRWEHGRYVGGAVATPEDLRAYSPPLRLAERYNRAQFEMWKKDYPGFAYALFSHSGPLGLTIEAMGFVEFCYALFDNRALIRESIEEKTRWFIETSRYAVEMGVDFVVMGDDMGFKDHGYVSLADFKELGFPYYRRIVDSLSVPVIWHSEGYVRDYLPLAVEAGIKGIHGIEPGAGMDLGEIKREFGADLVLLGNVDGNQIMCQKDLSLVRREVERCLREGMAGGGFILSLAGSAHDAVELEALLEMCRHNREAGVYR